MNYPVFLARQPPDGMSAEARQVGIGGKEKEGVRSGAETCGSVSAQSQAVHIHPTV